MDGDGHPDIVVGVGRSSFVGAEGGAVFVVSGKTGKELSRCVSPEPCLGFGMCVNEFVDFDHDGVRDFVVGAPHWTGYEFEHEQCKPSAPGAVYVCSGKTGKILTNFPGTSPGDRFGYALACIGDADKDGVIDLAVGAPGASEVRVLSGKDGHLIVRLQQEKAPTFGEAIVGVGDLDGDGHADVAVGGPNDGPSGRVRVFSGKDGHTMFVIEAGEFAAKDDAKRHADYRTRFGCSLALVPNYEGVGKPLLLIGADHVEDDGRVCLYSLTDRTNTRTLSGDSRFNISRFGSGVDVLADVDGDGVADFLVADADDDLDEMNTHGQAPGSVYLFSGKTSKQLYKVHGDQHLDRLGYAIAACGDLNADGTPDFVAEARVGWGEAPYFRAYSGKDGTLLFQFDAPVPKPPTESTTDR